jgi:hypothetical protein
LELKDIKKFRDKTASSLAACSEPSWCNVSSGVGNSGASETEQHFELVLEKSKPYREAAMRLLRSPYPPNDLDSAEKGKFTDGRASRTDQSWPKDDELGALGVVGAAGKGHSDSSGSQLRRNPQFRAEDSSSCPSHLQLSTDHSDHSLSSPGLESSLQFHCSAQNTQHEASSFLTPLTTQSSIPGD